MTKETFFHEATKRLFIAGIVEAAFGGLISLEYGLDAGGWLLKAGLTTTVIGGLPYLFSMNKK